MKFDRGSHVEWLPLDHERQKLEVQNARSTDLSSFEIGSDTKAQKTERK
jgi:hypothetical protein